MTLRFAMQNAPAVNVSENKDDRPKAQVWLNIGATIQLTNPSTGEVEDVFLALPQGIPLDTMEPMEVRGTNKNWANMVQAKNWVLEELKKMAEGIEPGGEQILEGLQIQVKRVGKAAVPDEGENPVLAAMQGRLSIIK